MYSVQDFRRALVWYTCANTPNNVLSILNVPDMKLTWQSCYQDLVSPNVETNDLKGKSIAKSTSTSIVENIK